MLRMARGGKTTTRRGRSGSSSVAPAAKHDPVTPDGMQYCVSCSKEVGDNAIGCDKCENWVHSSEMCSGLPQKVIEAITEYDGRGINFVCTKCRIRRESSCTGNPQPLMIELMDQLFQQLRGLCNTVQGLIEQVQTLSTKPSPQPSPPTLVTDHPLTSSLPPDGYKTAIRQEIKEMNEINKRRNSIIIKGLAADSPQDLSQKFSLLTQEVMGTPVTISDICPIRSHANIFRAKILNDDVWKQVLDKSKMLRDTVYNTVYISRDLTYSQRAEMFARRQARRSESTSAAQHPAVPPPGPAQSSSSSETSKPMNQGNSLTQ